MDERELLAVKHVLAEEFGITGIDDPADLQQLLQAKLAAMSRLDQIAFDMKLGGALKAIESSGDTAVRRYTLVGYLVVATAIWFLSRPLAIGVLLIGLSGQVRRSAIRNADLWTSGVAFLVGVAYGFTVGLLARLGSVLSGGGIPGSALFGLLGFLAAGYIGYRYPSGRVSADASR